VEIALVAGDPLHHYAAETVNENGHGGTPAGSELSAGIVALGASPESGVQRQQRSQKSEVRS
jgi:hypothetical protein